MQADCNRYVEGLQEKIKVFESQLNTRKSLSDGSDGGSLSSRLLSDHDRDHGAAAGLSALARVPAPTIPFSDAVTSHAAHRSHDDRSTSFMTSHVGNKTYEWDEGGDAKELGTDAMGTSSKGDHRSGFFGMHHPSSIPDLL